MGDEQEVCSGAREKYIYGIEGCAVHEILKCTGLSVLCVVVYAVPEIISCSGFHCSKCCLSLMKGCL